jgi:hypothetical protein
MPNPSDYEAEMSHPVHRPGMEKVVNRQHAADDPRDAAGNRLGSRPRPSPPTRSAFGADSSSSPAPTPAAAPPPADNSSTPAESPVSGIGGREREAQIMDYVDKAAGAG